MTADAKFHIGQLIHHRLFGYRGVVYDIDPEFSGTEEWYDQVARSRPPKDEPWYHVLVDEATHGTYVAEQNLEPDLEAREVQHPAISLVLGEFENGAYQPKQRPN